MRDELIRKCCEIADHLKTSIRRWQDTIRRRRITLDELKIYLNLLCQADALSEMMLLLARPKLSSEDLQAIAILLDKVWQFEPDGVAYALVLPDEIVGLGWRKEFWVYINGQVCLPIDRIFPS